MAEELVQETFVRLWRSAAKYDPARGTVRTFVFTIARRVAVDLMRPRPRGRFPSRPQMSRSEAASAPPPGAAAAAPAKRLERSLEGR